MAPLDRRVRLLGWVLRRLASIPSLTEADLTAMQSQDAGPNIVTGRICGSLLPGVTVHDRTITGPADDVAVRIYRPDGGGGTSTPLILNFHGGGFVFGGPSTADWLCSSVAAGVGAVVVSVDYRLAPKHPFPAAIDDCYTTLEWAATRSEELGANGPLAVMGESAGGNLAAVTCLRARDRNGPPISHQALLYPVTDMTTEGRPATSSAVQNTDAPILSQSEMFFYRSNYLGPADPADPRVSPLLAGDHTGLPPTLIQVAEHDPLRDDGIRYARALREAGVPVRLTQYVGMPHGYLSFPGVCRAAPQAMAELCAEQHTTLTAPLTSSPGLAAGIGSRSGVR